MALTRVSVLMSGGDFTTFGVMEDKGDTEDIQTINEGTYGSQEYPYIFSYGMDVDRDKYYSYNDKLYLAKSDMPACVWPPDTEGLWQWELVV